MDKPHTPPSVGIAVITHTAEKHLKKCLPPLISSPVNPRVLVVNSSSKDGTVPLARELGAETLVLPRKEFNHGSTREKARRHLDTDIVLMVTPDAYASPYAVERLIEPLVRGEASIAYARQKAHDGAGFFESFPREFNYPAASHIRSMKEVDKWGVYTFFCSDSFAAYDNRALDEIGGFPSVLLGEDTVVAAKLLRMGRKIAYVAEAEVQHSHAYSLAQEFKRHFDTGLARRGMAHLLAAGGKDSKRGLAYAGELLKATCRKCPHMLPYALAQTATKWLGYKIGSHSASAPLWWKKAFSSQDFYWVSDDYRKGRP